MREFRRGKNIINPDMTPLIDVVFQLLIFFMLVTTFSQYTKFDMNLPKSSVKQIDSLEEVKLSDGIINGDYFRYRDGLPPW